MVAVEETSATTLADDGDATFCGPARSANQDEMKIRQSPIGDEDIKRKENI